MQYLLVIQILLTILTTWPPRSRFTKTPSRLNVKLPNVNRQVTLTRDELGQLGHLHYIAVVPGHHLVEMLGHLSVRALSKEEVKRARETHTPRISRVRKAPSVQRQNKTI